jgi:hypothetical protein
MSPWRHAGLGGAELDHQLGGEPRWSPTLGMIANTNASLGDIQKRWRRAIVNLRFFALRAAAH